MAVKSFIAEVPSRMKFTQPCSAAVTCLIRPPRHSSLTVVRCLAWSSVRPRVVKRRKSRFLARVASRSARSASAKDAAAWRPAARSPVIGVLVVMFWAFRGCGAGFRSRSKPTLRAIAAIDRKSTRLNSSHANISHAVFCLKKKQVQLRILVPVGRACERELVQQASLGLAGLDFVLLARELFFFFHAHTPTPYPLSPFRGTVPF